MAQITIEVQRLANHHGLELPEYKSPRAAGCDLLAALPLGEEWEVPPGGQIVVPTGIALAIPNGFEGQIRPRSGLARDYQIGVTNAPGTIDGDFRGELMVILRNFGPEPFIVIRGDRIAQLTFHHVYQAQWITVSQLPVTVRGEGGFGSTGRRGGEIQGRATVRGLAAWSRPADHP